MIGMRLPGWLKRERPAAIREHRPSPASAPQSGGADSLGRARESGRSAAEIEALRSEMMKLAPWYSYYDFGDGVITPNTWEQVNADHFRTRAARLFGALAQHVDPKDCTLLDVGCADGYFSVEAATRGYRSVTGIDFRSDAIARARFAARALDIDNLEFREANVYSRADLGPTPYDVVICQGLFYHLSNPVLGLQNVRAVTGKVAFMAGWTVIRKDPVFYVRSEEVSDIRNGDQSVVLVPTAAGITKTLELIGYRKIIDINPWTSEPDWQSDQGDWREYLAFV